MSISVRKNHLPDIGARSVEKGLTISIHTITHLKYKLKLEHGKSILDRVYHIRY